MRSLLCGIILVLLAVSPWSDAPRAEGLDIRLKSSEGFRTPRPKEPSSAAQFADAVIARPLGLATTIAGTTFFVATLPFTAGSGDVREAARGLVKKPAGWTFKRRLGRREPRFEDQSIFAPYP